MYSLCALETHNALISDLLQASITSIVLTITHNLLQLATRGDAGVVSRAARVTMSIPWWCCSILLRYGNMLVLTHIDNTGWCGWGSSSTEYYYYQRSKSLGNLSIHSVTSRLLCFFYFLLIGHREKRDDGVDIQVNTDYDNASALSLRIFGIHYSSFEHLFFLVFFVILLCTYRLVSHRVSCTVDESCVHDYHKQNTSINCHQLFTFLRFF